MSDRWATFDCYGTLIDWNGGVRASSRGSSGRSRPTGCSSATTRSSRDPGGRPDLPTVTSWPARSSGSMRRRARWRPRPLAALLGPVPRGAGRARGGEGARLEARDPLEHRPRLHRRVQGAARDPIRRDDRRLRDRFLQARASPLVGVLRAHARRPRAPRPRRREPLSRHRPCVRARPAQHLDQPPRRARRSAAHA